MFVGSNLEIYTTMFGWVVYEIIWDIMRSTGLVFIPIIVMFYTNMREPHISQEVRPASITSMKRVRWDLIVSLVVLTLFLLPAKSLTIDKVKYVSPPTFSNPGSLIEVSGDATKIPQSEMQGVIQGGVKVPYGWLFVVNATNGINQMLMASLPHPTDLRAAAAHLNSAYIHDETLNSELQEFSSRCHTPALQKYRKNHAHFRELGRNNAWSGESPYTVISDGNIPSVSRSEGDDLSWMGSRILSSLPGLYKECRITTATSCPVGSGFSRTLENGSAEYCDSWWIFLRSKVITYAKSDRAGEDGLSFYQKGELALAALVGDVAQGVQEDILVREIIEANGENRTGLELSDQAYHTTMFTNSAVLNAGASLVKAWDTSGTLKDASVRAGFIAYVAHIGLPMVKALLAMAITWFIPFFFMVAGYHNVEKLMMLILGVFTIHMMSAFWSLAYWVDQNLAVILYGGSTGVWDYVKGHFTGQHRIVLDIVSTTFYMVVPTLFGLVMAWAGTRVAQGAAQQSTNNSDVEKSSCRDKAKMSITASGLKGL